MRSVFFAGLLLITGLSACTSQKQFRKSIYEDFNHAEARYFQYHTSGSHAAFKSTMGVNSPTEPEKKILSFSLDPDDSAGAGRGPEIVSKRFTYYGTYTARLKIPDVRSIQPDVGAVVGYFTYYMDRENGLSEIDFEWLLADPEIIYIGTWTGPHGSLRRIGRTINPANGKIYNTETHTGYNGKRIPLTGEQNLPATIPTLENYDASSRFYTYGFDWYPDHLRWWMLHPETGDTLVLWNYSGSKLGIPQNKSLYRMNFWRTNNWSVETNPASTERPLHPYELEIDWMSFTPLKE